MKRKWFEQKRLDEQLKFFGAKKTKFISCYAKKPRIRIEIKNESIHASTAKSFEYLRNQGTADLLANMSYLRGQFLLAIQYRQRAQIEACNQIAQQQRVALSGHTYSTLSGLVGGLGAAVMGHKS